MYTNAPTLLSENLILRGPEARDQEPVIAFLQDEDRAAGFGALPNRGDAWRWFALNVGHWAMHGYGYFMIETKAGENRGNVRHMEPRRMARTRSGLVGI